MKNHRPAKTDSHSTLWPFYKEIGTGQHKNLLKGLRVDSRDHLMEEEGLIDTEDFTLRLEEPETEDDRLIDGFALMHLCGDED